MSFSVRSLDWVDRYLDFADSDGSSTGTERGEVAELQFAIAHDVV